MKSKTFCILFYFLLLSHTYAQNDPTADSWSTNGTNTTTTDNIGIGLASPTGALHIKALNYQKQLILDRTDNSEIENLMYLAPSYAPDGNDRLDINIGDTGRQMVILESGQIGIGIGAPAHWLHVYKEGSSTVDLLNLTASTGQAELELGANNQNIYYHLRNTATAIDWLIKLDAFDGDQLKLVREDNTLTTWTTDGNIHNTGEIINDESIWVPRSQKIGFLSDTNGSQRAYIRSTDNEFGGDYNGLVFGVGSENEVMYLNGSGNYMKFLGINLALNEQYISNDGDDEGIQVEDNGDVTMSGSLGVGTTPDAGVAIHAFLGNSGATASTNADAIVLEAADNVGISFLSPNNFSGSLYFGDPENNIAGRITYENTNDRFTFRTNGVDQFKMESDGDFVCTRIGAGISPLYGVQIENNHLALHGGSNTISFETCDMPLIYATASGGTYPFNTYGNLIIQPRNGNFDIGLRTGTNQEKGFYITGQGYLSADGDDEGIIIDNSGNVGIGTNQNLTDAKLNVNGKIKAEEIQIQQDVLPDFVFNADYSLMSLEETETFIKQNKHLPAIPTAQEAKENGINMGEMQAKLLQKIEELTLHMIEVNKKVDKLEKENQRLNQIISSK